MRDDKTIDSTQFRGPGAVFALILAHVRRDFTYAPVGSRAYETAKLFIDGGTCEHDGEVYDWGRHRDLIVGSLGIDVKTFCAAVKAGRAE